MDAKTLAALKASIEHWREVETMPARKALDEIGADTCPLCCIFNTRNHTSLTRCLGCPLEDDYACGGGSHYDRAEEAADDGDEEAWAAAARAMREKLESLLPDSERQ